MHTSSKADVAQNVVWRLSAAQTARDFLDRHNALTVTHEQSIKRIMDGCPMVRISHQPNLFAGLNIGGLLIIAEKLAERSGGVVMFVSIDYDDAGDQRFRSPLLPPLQGKNPVRIKGAVKKADRGKAAFAAPAPGIRTVKDWVALHRQATTQFAADLNMPRIPSAFADLDTTELLDQSDSLTDFNLALILNLSSHINKTPVLFTQASQCLSSLNSEINLLLAKILLQYPERSSDLAWRICDLCYRRCHATLKLQQGSSIHCTWYCPTCLRGAEQVLDWATRLASKDWPAFTPKVLLCDMIDYHIIQADLSVSYAGGMEHSIASRKLYNGLAGARELRPEYAWRPSAMPFSPSGELQELWNSGRFSSYLYHDLFGVEILRENILRSIPHSLSKLL